jgi:hypothetical protein
MEKINKEDPEFSNDILMIIADIVSKANNIPIEMMRLNSRKREIVSARYQSMDIQFRFAKCTSESIASFYPGSTIKGIKEHSSVFAAIKAIQNRYDTEPEFRKFYDDLIKLCVEAISVFNQSMIKNSNKDWWREKQISQLMDFANYYQKKKTGGTDPPELNFLITRTYVDEIILGRKREGNNF